MILLPIIYILLIFVSSSLVFGASCEEQYLYDNILCAWQLEENGFDFLEQTGNCTDFTTGNAPTQDTLDCIDGNCQNIIRANTDYIRTDTSTIYEQSAYTYSMFFKLDSINNNQLLFSNHYRVAPNSFGGFLYIDTNEKLQSQVYSGVGVTSDWETGGTVLTTGTWYHIAMAWDGNILVYLNGSDDEAAYGNATDVISYSVGNHRTNVGELFNPGASNFLLDGNVDELYMFDVVLNNTCITALQDTFYPFIDTESPDIDIIYPVNTTTYNDFTGNITVNATDDSGVDDCNINNTDWTKRGVAGTLWDWNRTTTPDGNYSIAVNCSDTIGNYRISVFWFVVDTFTPPVNGSLSCIDCLNTTINCSETYAVNSTAWDVQQRICKGGEDFKMLLAALVIAPLLLGLMFLLGSFFLGEDHTVFKIGLFILSPITFWTSMNFAVIGVSEIYNIPELINIIGKTTYWTGMFFFITLTYFLLYGFYKIVNVAAQKKKERLQY